MVYRLLLISAQSGELTLSTDEFQQRNCLISTAILRVNRQIHNEAIEILYVLNRVILPLVIGWRRIRKLALIRKDQAGGHDLALRSGSTYHFVRRKGVIHESMLRRLADIEFSSRCWGYRIAAARRPEKLVTDFFRNLIKILAKDDTVPEVGASSAKKTLHLNWKNYHGPGERSAERLYKVMFTHLSETGLFKDLRSLAKVRNVVVKDDTPFREEFYQRLLAEEPSGSGLGHE